MKIDSFRVQGHWTRIHETAFVAPGCHVIGDVHLAAATSVWFGAVIRADTEEIRVGARSNVQDGAVLHADPGYPCYIGSGVTIGHRAVVHGARVGDFCTIGMGAIVMNGATLGDHTMVAAGAVVVGGRSYPSEHLLIGSPARAVRPLRQDELASLEDSAQHYVDAANAYMACARYSKQDK